MSNGTVEASTQTPRLNILYAVCVFEPEDQDVKSSSDSSISLDMSNISDIDPITGEHMPLPKMPQLPGGRSPSPNYSERSLCISDSVSNFADDPYIAEFLAYKRQSSPLCEDSSSGNDPFDIFDSDDAPEDSELGFKTHFVPVFDF